MNLIPQIGFDNIEFGMTKSQVIDLLGLPDVEKMNCDDKEIFMLEWYDLKTRLSFYKEEDNRLGYIRTKNPDLTIFDQKIIDLKINEVINSVFKKRIDSWEIEDYETFWVYFNDENWLSLTVEYNLIDSLEMGVPFLNDDEYKWPN